MKSSTQELLERVDGYGIDDSIAEYLNASHRDFEVAASPVQPRWLQRFLQGLTDLIAGASRRSAPGTTAQYSKPALGPCNRFSVLRSRIRSHPAFSETGTCQAPLGFFGGRPIIGEGSPINGGVYLSALPHEALVIDARHGALDLIFRELHSMVLAKNSARRMSEDQILQEVINITCRKLCFDESRTEKLTLVEEIGPDQKISLDLFITAGTGVARHQVLLAAYLVESLKERGFLRGFCTIDSSSQHPSGDDERLVYTNESGRVFVFDPRTLAETQPHVA